MKNGRIAVPSAGSGGIDGLRSEHFGHCESFTLIDVKDGEISEISIATNGDHHEGGCMVPVNKLSELDVNAIIVAGIGMRPLQGFDQVGIDVYIDQISPQIKTVVENLIAGRLSVISPRQICGGGEGGCHNHDHANHSDLTRG
ncbi:NifB/NifX family molybdenum-iron cluster-binding protein [Calditrichota bacterium]